MDIAGIDWAAKILPLRVLGKCGEGDFSDIYDAIAWAAGFPVPGVPANPTPAQVINLSLGRHERHDLLRLPRTRSSRRSSPPTARARSSPPPATTATTPTCTSRRPVRRSSRWRRRRRTGSATSYTNTGATVDLSAPGGEPVEHRPRTDSGALQRRAHRGRATDDPRRAGNELRDADGVGRDLAHAVGRPEPDAGAGALDPRCRARSRSRDRRPATTATCGSGILDAHASVARGAGGRRRRAARSASSSTSTPASGTTS